jgi:hypothetical protein
MFINLFESSSRKQARKKLYLFRAAPSLSFKLTRHISAGFYDSFLLVVVFDFLKLGIDHVIL